MTTPGKFQKFEIASITYGETEPELTDERIFMVVLL